MSLSLVRLLQLASPALPVGAYSYSQGLEWAVEAGTVHDETSALRWIGDVLEWNIGRFETPWLVEFLAAWKTADAERLQTLDADFIASRETAEVRAETLQMGYSLKRLVEDLPAFPEAIRDTLRGFDPASFPLAWSGVAVAWEVTAQDAVAGYLWSWCENQVMAALKAVPLGQSAGQRILGELAEGITEIARRAMSLPEDAIANFTPGLAIASSRHETQYSRLFRS